MGRAASKEVSGVGMVLSCYGIDSHSRVVMQERGAVRRLHLEEEVHERAHQQ